MSAAMAAQMGAQFVGNLYAAYMQKAIGDAQGKIDDANTYAQNATNRANADAANSVRLANNGFAAAQAAFSNLTRSLSNQSNLESGGKAEDALTTNLLRLQDQTARGSLESQLRSAEQLGAVRAAAAAAGVGGTTARMLQNTMQLMAARVQTITDQNAKYQTYDMLQQRAGLVSNKIMSLDEGQSFAPIDYNINVAPLVQSPIRASRYMGSVFGQALLTTLSQNAGNIASMTFGGSAGSATTAGEVGNTAGYSSGAILNGVNHVGNNSFNFSTGLGNRGNGFFSTNSSNKIADFQLN